MQLILTGGFLGSGKTTAIQKASALLLAENKRVAVITNDQGDDLVDTKFIKGLSIPVKEVIKGCFCCNYNGLLQNIYYFNEHIHPDIIFCEAVGSCTDIVATIVKPLAELHPELNMHVSVFVDAALLHSIIAGTASFIDEAVRYIFKKQMAEADTLILNKTDLLTSPELEAVQKVMQQEYGDKTILLQNSLKEEDVQHWINCFEKPMPAQRKSLDINYNIYGAGEAKLAWLDAVLSFQTEKLPAVKAAVLFAEIVYEKIKQQHLTIGHLKYFIDDKNNLFKISYTTSDHHQPLIPGGISAGASVIVNARVQTEPEVLKHIILEAIDETTLKAHCNIQVQSLSAFKPGFPTPTHRIGN